MLFSTLLISIDCRFWDSNMCRPVRLARARWPRHFALIRATPLAEVDIINAELCSFARAIFPRLAFFKSDRSLPPIIVDNRPNMKTERSRETPEFYTLWFASSQVKAAARGLTSDINNAPDILCKINNLCPMDVPCQSNAESYGTWPDWTVPDRVGNLL